MLSDVFENFRNMCIEIYEHDPAKKFSAPGSAWQVALKKIKVKSGLYYYCYYYLLIFQQVHHVSYN